MREILVASIETLGMAPSWAALVYGIAAIGGGVVLAIVRDYLTGMAIVAGGVWVLSLVGGSQVDLHAPDGWISGAAIAWYGGAIVLTLLAFQGGTVERDANPVSRLFHSLLGGLLVGGLVFWDHPPPYPVGIALGIFGALLLSALHSLSRFLVAVTVVRLLFGIFENPTVPWVFIAGGPLILVSAVFEIHRRWRFRRRVWLTEPDQLLRPHPIARWTLVAVWCLSAALGAAILTTAPSLTGTCCLTCGAIGVLTFGHLADRPAFGEVGLALAAAILAFTVILFGGSGAIPAASALAGLWMMWLARFWGQQLRDGEAWTTAGRLIHSARRIGAAAAFVMMFTVWISPGLGIVPAVAALVLGLAFVAALTIAAGREQCGGSAVGALAAATGVALLAARLLPDALPAFLAPPLAAVLVAVLGGVVAMSRNKDGEIVRAAWIGVGAVTVIGIAISRPEEPQLFVAASITLISGLLYAALSRRPHATVDSQS